MSASFLQIGRRTAWSRAFNDFGRRPGRYARGRADGGRVSISPASSGFHTNFAEVVRAAAVGTSGTTCFVLLVEAGGHGYRGGSAGALAFALSTARPSIDGVRWTTEPRRCGRWRGSYAFQSDPA